MATIKTSRFGAVEVDPKKLIRFPRGLVGLAPWEYYTLIQTNPENSFLWLQSTQVPELAFVVCDPCQFVPDYSVRIKQEDRRELRLRAGQQAEVLAICNKVGKTLTANLQGPLVINPETLLGKQLVLSDRRLGTRHPLVVLEAQEDVPATKTA